MPNANRAGCLPPLIFGEVLFDHFPDGRSVLGGAPFNVAWNLQGLGNSPHMLTAVGKDAEGELVLKEMQNWGMERGGVQQHPQLSTGRVVVTLAGGQPTYEILHPCAFDQIELPEQAIDAAHYSLLYYGTLAARDTISQSTLLHLVQHSGLPRFVDLNIRQPWFDRALVRPLLDGAEWVKLNDEELAELSGQPHSTVATDILCSVRIMREKYGGSVYFVTCGAAGAYALVEDRIHFAPSPVVQNLQDTVGAGDAFTAATLHQLLRQVPSESAIRLAVQFAAQVCAIRGATTTARNLYQFEGWEDDINSNEDSDHGNS